MRGEARRRQAPSGRRGSYFFVIDGFIASAIFVSTIIIVFALFVHPTPKAQSYTYGFDYLHFLTTTQLRDYQSDTVRALRTAGEITDTHNTIATQVLVFHSQGKDGLAWQLLNSTMPVLPSTISVNVSLLEPSGVNATIYNRSFPAVTNRTHLVVREIEYAPSASGTLYGPAALQVEVWS